MDKLRALYLIQQYRDQSITEEELNELRQWMEEHADSPFLKEAIEEDILQNAHAEIISAERLDIMFQNVMNADKVRVLAPVKRIWIRWVAAAVIVLMVVGGWWMIERKASRQQGNEATAIKHDVPAPSNTRAVITLADGSKVYLDSAGNGVLAQQSDVNVIKNNNGEIIYNREDGKTQGEIAYNTLYNPRGSKAISLTLSDGTKVWLNSESSLRYPASFSASFAFREVEITGEAYFEVKHNSKQPFKVHLPNGSVVEDIGTSFNINAYPDEDATKTTLIEGSVKIMSPAGGGDLRNTPNNKRPGVENGIILKPGQQAVYNANSQQLTANSSVDIDQVLAWKNGLFNFDGADLQTIMRQIARWYDVDVVYEGSVTKEPYKGEINRNVPASKVLQMLEYLGVKFKIEGKKITVMK